MSLPNWTLSNPWHFLATGMGSGLAKKAPGTAGSAFAVVLYLLFLQWLPPLGLAVIILIGFALGVVICQKAADDRGVHDDPQIVWDEFIGQWIALMWVPWGVWGVLAAFVLFRLFDITKPWPIKWVDDKVDGGLGIMLDDVLAGLFALAALQLLVVLF